MEDKFISKSMRKSDNDYEKVLDFFRTNGVMTLKDLSLILHMSEERTKIILNYLLGKENNWLIRKVSSDNSLNVYEITFDGLQYLRSIQLQNLQQKQTNFNRILAFTSIILVICNILQIYLLFTK